MAKRRIAQKISFLFAILFYLSAFGCVAATFFFGNQKGSDHPVVASLAAAVVFFVGAGIVLHVMGRANLPDLRIDRSPPGGV